MWNFKYKNQYLNYVSDLMQDTAVQSMRLLPQHRAGVSCYHHSVLVSYASWRVCDWLGLDARAAARGGLLHDFYLYNWRDAASHPGIRHGSQHPEVALRNARARFSLTWREEDIILSHMFPYTPTKVYRCLESAVVMRRIWDGFRGGLREFLIRRMENGIWCCPPDLEIRKLFRGSTIFLKLSAWISYRK